MILIKILLTIVFLIVTVSLIAVLSLFSLFLSAFSRRTYRRSCCRPIGLILFILAILLILKTPFI